MDSCLFCGEPATHLCDYPLALALGGIVKQKGQAPYEAVTMEAMLSGSYTCDAAFCAKHGKPVGHICGGDDGCETIDHCKGDHDSGQKRVLSLKDIAALRDTLHARWRKEISDSHARWRRSQFTTVDTMTGGSGEG